MQVRLLAGEGWNPFVASRRDGAPPVVVDGADRLDAAASAPRLAALWRRLVLEEYPDADVRIVATDPGGARLVEVRFDADDGERFEDLTGVAPSAVDDPAIAGPDLVREAVYALLGEALETPGWRVARRDP